MDEDDIHAEVKHIHDEVKHIHGEVERERRKSKFRDRCSRDRVHPITHDLVYIVDFVIDRRTRHARAAFVATRRVLTRVDTEAMRYLVDVVLEGGACDVTTRRRCGRLLEYCNAVRLSF